MSSSIIADERIMQKCQIFTPADIVSKMLDIAGYQDDLFGKKILENAAGNGEILIQIVQRYIESCEKADISKRKTKKGLETDIVAYEIDENRVKECKERLDEITQKHNISKVHWNIQCADYLQLNNSEKYDFIIGNPPYIAYPDLPRETQDFVKNNFSSCEKGKFDYCYAFIEKSYYSLANNGNLVYIIPSNIFKNVFAKRLRDIIKDDIYSIYDFPNDKIFKKVLVSPAIICVKKGCTTSEFTYHVSNTNRIIRKSCLGEKWFFDNLNSESGQRIGDFFKVSSAVATLLNEVFVLKSGTINNGFYEFGDNKIEVALIKKAASPKNKKYNNIEYIIFPYFYDSQGKLQHYSEKQMYKNFPYAMKYLKLHKEQLQKRDADINAKWFEYGRSQALQNINQKLILISSVISECTEPYMLDIDEVPYSGLYIVPISNMSLDCLLPILKSSKFKDHIKTTGVCVSGTSKRITPKDIERFCYK